MDNGETEVVEPLSGSSVIVEPVNEPVVPDNGFPIGYGPNEGMKRPEAPKRPKFSERMKRTIQKLTKKQKIWIVSLATAGVLVAVGVVVFVLVSGVFKTDYSGAYVTAKELRVQMQGLRSDASCSKVADYVDNPYTTMKVYQSYIESCKEVGAGVESEIVTALGNTPGVLKNEKIGRKYEAFKIAMESAKSGNANVDDVLDLYALWHKWVIAENKGDNDHTNWSWTDADIAAATEILEESNNADMIKYVKEWKEKKTAAAKATRTCLYPENPEDGCPTELREEMISAQKNFEEWKKDKAFKITRKLPLDMVDTAKLYEKFTELYEEIRKTYQENYNYEVGGCKELVGQVVCD